MTGIDPAELGERIVANRREMGWSQAELARRSGVAEATLSKIERGEGAVQASKLRAVLDAVGIPPAVEATPVDERVPDDVRLVLDVLGLWLRSLDPSARAAQVLRMIRFTYDEQAAAASSHSETHRLI